MNPTLQKGIQTIVINNINKSLKVLYRMRVVDKDMQNKVIIDKTKEILIVKDNYTLAAKLGLTDLVTLLWS